MRAGKPGYLLAATLCGATAIYLGWLGAYRDPSLRVPPTVAFIAAGVFALAAARIAQVSLRPGTTGDAFAALILAGLAAISAWIALSPEAVTCTFEVNDRTFAGATGLGCRIPFGIGALVTSAIAVYAAVRLLSWHRS